MPDAVRHKATALGASGHRWLEELPETVERISSDWSLVVTEVLRGGSGGFVARARADDGASVILKVALPDGLEGQAPFTHELRALQLVGGRGYVRVLRFDETAGALLLEQLGPPLADLGLTIEAQIDVIVETLRPTWVSVPAEVSLRSGVDQAIFLGSFIPSLWEELGHPCDRRLVERAVTYAQSRADAFRAATSVLVHGDAHPSNILQDPAGVAGTFRLIDPEGMRSEPAHDLAIPLRDWTDELLAGDPFALGRQWCERLARAADVDFDALWEWAFVERMSTGLFFLRLGNPAGSRFLEVAEHWAER